MSRVKDCSAPFVGEPLSKLEDNEGIWLGAFVGEYQTQEIDDRMVELVCEELLTRCSNVFGDVVSARQLIIDQGVKGASTRSRFSTRVSEDRTGENRVWISMRLRFEVDVT